MPYIKAHIVVKETDEKLTIREGGFYMNAENVYNIHRYDYHPVLGKDTPRTCVELTPHKGGEKRFVIFNAPLEKVEDMLLNSHKAMRQSKNPRIKYLYNDMNNVMDATLITLSQEDFDRHYKTYLTDRKAAATLKREREVETLRRLVHELRRR
jgi:hypothetical protein